MNRYMPVVLIACLLGLTAPVLAEADLAAAGNVKACFVDLQEVLQNFPDYGKAKENLQTWAKPKQDMISAKEKDLQTLDSELKKSMLLSNDAKADKEKKFKTELEGYQTLVKQLQTELSDKEEELLAPVKQSLAKTIEIVSKEKGFNLVFDAAAPAGRPILYVDDSLDITQDVIKKLKEGMDAKDKMPKETKEKK